MFVIVHFSSTDESECPFDCNFTFAFLGDGITKQLEKVPNVYFPEVQGVSSLKDVTTYLKEIQAGRVSVYRCIRMKDGSTQECQISLQFRPASSFDPECDAPPFGRNRLKSAGLPFVVQGARQVGVVVPNSAPQAATVHAGWSRREAVSQQPPCSPPFEMSSPSHKTSNLLSHIRAYEKACLLKYGNDSLEAEGAPVYTVTQKERRRMSLLAVRNRTLSSGDAATAVFHMINLAAMKNGL